jgi:hypothetical protein
MKRYIITLDPAISNTTSITLLKRTTDGLNINGNLYTLWAGRTIPNDYNDPSFYIRNREVASIVGSTTVNTIITNDGIVAVLRESNKLEVVDIFELEDSTYEEIDPNGYSLLDYYNELVNPISKRVFSVYKKVGQGDILFTNNILQFIENGNYHFYSQFDYDLLLDEYGYYITNSSDWNSTYLETSDFQFYKKSYFRIESSDTIILTAPTDLNVNITHDSGVYTLKYLDVSDEDKFINFNISSGDFDTGYIIIY